MFDYISGKTRGKEAELEASLEHTAGYLGAVREENARLRAALQLIDDYYQTGGDLMSHVSHIARDALACAQCEEKS